MKQHSPVASTPVSTTTNSVATAKAEFVAAVRAGVEALMERCGYSRERAVGMLLRELSRGGSGNEVASLSTHSSTSFWIRPTLTTDPEFYDTMKRYGLGMEDASRVLIVSRAVRQELQTTDGIQSSPAPAEAIGRLVAKLSLDNLLYESPSEAEEFEKDVGGDDDHGIVAEEFREQLQIRPEALSTQNASSGSVGRKNKGNNRKRKHQAHATTTTTTTSSTSNNLSSGFASSSVTATAAIPTKRTKTDLAVISNKAAGSKKRSLEDADDIVPSGSSDTTAMKDDAAVTPTRQRSDSLVVDMDAKMAAANSQGDNLGSTSRAESLSSNNSVSSGAASASAMSVVRPRKRLQRAAKSSSAAAASAAGGAAVVDGESSG